MLETPGKTIADVSMKEIFLNEIVRYFFFLNNKIKNKFSIEQIKKLNQT